MTAADRLADLTELATFGSATVGEVTPNPRILDSGLRPIRPGVSAAGLAYTVACKPGDNLAIHHAIAALGPGDLLVVDYGGSLDTAPFGEILALACLQRRARGLVIDGAVRDSAQICALGFPVFCRGVSIPGTSKADRGRAGVPVRVGGVEIRPGDIVLADQDAVVAIAEADLDRTLEDSRLRLAREADIMDRIRHGESTIEIFGLRT